MLLKNITEDKLRNIAQQLLRQVNQEEDVLTVEAFIDEELDKTYNTYLLTSSYNNKFIMKKSDNLQEKQVYKYAFTNDKFNVPIYYGDIEQNTEDSMEIYMLLQYIEGEDLRKATLKQLRNAVIELAKIHRHFLETRLEVKVEYDFDRKLSNILKRDEKALSKKESLMFNKFYRVYQMYVERCKQAPKTLINDDLLPINILANETSSTIIDWGYAHISPYMLDIARLVCHEYEKDKFFIPQEFHKELEELYYQEMCKSSKFNVSYEQYLVDIKLAKFQERSYWIIWKIREDEELEEDPEKDFNLKACVELANEIIPD